MPAGIRYLEYAGRILQALQVLAHEHRMRILAGDGLKYAVAIMQATVSNRQVFCSDAVDQDLIHCLFNTQCPQQALGLGTRFDKFMSRIGVGNNTAAGAKADPVAFSDQRADKDV